MSTEQAKEQSLEDLVEQVDETAADGSLTIGKLLDQFKSQSYGPLLLIFGFLALSPIGAIPGMSLFLGTIIITIALQILFGQTHPWLPQKLENVEFPGKKLSKVLERIKPWVSWLQKFLKRRWDVLSGTIGLRVLSVIIILLALTFYPLALVPGGVAVPSSAICLLAIGLTTRDGIVLLCGYLLAGAGVILLTLFWPF